MWLALAAFSCLQRPRKRAIVTRHLKRRTPNLSSEQFFVPSDANEKRVPSPLRLSLRPVRRADHQRFARLTRKRNIERNQHPGDRSNLSSLCPSAKRSCRACICPSFFAGGMEPTETNGSGRSSDRIRRGAQSHGTTLSGRRFSILVVAS
jgi:hypothetical protein